MSMWVKKNCEKRRRGGTLSLHETCTGSISRDPTWTCDGEVMQEAVNAGDGAFMAWHLTHCLANDISWLVPMGAVYGYLPILDWFALRGDIPVNVIEVSLSIVLEDGPVEALNWFHENVESTWPVKAIDLASKHGRLEIVEHLHSIRPDGCTVRAMTLAAENGHLDVVKWLHTNRTEGCTPDAMDSAARNGHLTVLQWLDAHRTEGCTTNAMDLAAMNGHLDVLQWLHAHRTEGCTTRAMNLAAKFGHLTVLQWLDAHRTEGCTTNAMDLAAMNGHLGALQWLHAHRTEGCTTGAMNLAAKFGHLDVLQWLHANRTEGCTTNAMDLAAENGHLDVLQWLHVNRTEGCTSNAMLMAAMNGHFAVVHYLHLNKITRCALHTMNWAAESGNLELVQWLHAIKEMCTTDAMDLAAKNGHLNVVQWLHENRTEGCTTYAMEWAAESGHLDVVQWLHANRGEGCTKVAMEWTESAGHLNILEWLIQNRIEIKRTAKHLHDAIEQRQLRIVRALYDREELKCWPRPPHAKILFDLFCSNHLADRSTFEYIVGMRQKRYRPEDPNNPYGEKDDENQERAMVEMASVEIVCRRYGAPLDIGKIISEFIVGNDSTRVRSHSEAVQRGWVHWLYCFSNKPNQDMMLLAESGNLDGARLLHDRLKRDNRLRCSKRFMYWTMTEADRQFVSWHLLNCGEHSREDWLYAAVWRGRREFIDCIPKRRSGWDEPILLRDSSPKMFHSLDASFTEVAERFQPELMAAEAHENRDSVNAMDLAAIHGRPFPSDLSIRLDQDTEKRLRLGCTVTGIYGAIVNGHVNVVRQIYEMQPELAKWPKLEDGPEVLRRLLNPVKKKMLKFFRYERDMRLPCRDLDEAAFRGDVGRVKLLRELDLADLTSNAVEIAAVRGDSWMLRFSLAPNNAVRPRVSHRAIVGAAEEGHASIIQDLNELGAPCTADAIDLAARNGHLEVVKFLFENRQEGCSEWALYWASGAGHTSVVEYLVSRAVPCNIDNCETVAKSQGNQAIVDILESYRATRIQNRDLSRSSRYLAHCQRKVQVPFDRSVTHTIYGKIERLLWPSGLPSDLKSGVPVPPQPLGANSFSDSDDSDNESDYDYDSD